MKSKTKLRARVLRSALFISIVSLTTVVHAAPDPEEGWTGTRANIDLIHYFTVQKYPCTASPKNMLGCIQLINNLGTRVTPNLRLATTDSLQLTRGLQTQILATYGPLKLARISNNGDQPTTIKEHEALDARTRQILLAASATLTARGPAIDFDSLLRLLLGRLPHSISSQRAIGLALDSLLEVHDWHSHLNPVRYLNDMAEDADAQIAGIGVDLDKTQGQVFVGTAYDHTPAQTAGIKAGDRIVAVDDQPIQGLLLSKVGEILQGQPGSTVKISAVDVLGAAKEFTLQRTVFTIPNLSARIVNDIGQNFLYLKLKSFIDEQACTGIEAALESYPDSRGIILDLRDNDGGMINQARCIGGLFLGKKTLFLERDVVGDEIHTEPRSVGTLHSQATEKSLIVLLNESSASATEILSAALQDYSRAWILGLRSYGKGSVQEGRTLPVDRSIFWYQTTEVYSSPLDHAVQAVGVTPDFEVGQTPDHGNPVEHLEREEDFKPYVLSPVGQISSRPREAQARILQTRCFDQGLRSEALYAQRLMTGDKSDFQLLKAEELMDCGDR